MEQFPPVIAEPLSILTLGADLLSRGNPHYKDRNLHSEVVAQIWERYGETKVDRFESEENSSVLYILWEASRDISTPV